MLLGLLGILAFVFGVLAWSKVSAPPDEKSGSTGHDEDSTKDNREYLDSTMRPMKVVVESLPPATEEEKTREKNKSRREWQTLIAQWITAGLVFVYATVAIFQYCEMKHANKLTSEALELNRKMFSASQVAAFECSAGVAANSINVPYTEVLCSNGGNVAARNVTESVTYTRQTKTGKVAYQKSREVTRAIVPKGQNIDELFHMDVPYDPVILSKYIFRVMGSVTCENGLSRTTQPLCFEMIVNVPQRNLAWTTCENAPELRKYPR